VTASTEIPTQEWSHFLEEFSRRHQGWLVDLEGDGTETLADHELEAITAQLSGKEPAFSVVVRNRRLPPGHSIYSIPTASMLRVEDGNGTEKRLIIESPDRRWCIRLRQVVRPPA
jgi:hypothetical protein